MFKLNNGVLPPTTPLNVTVPVVEVVRAEAPSRVPRIWICPPPVSVSAVAAAPNVMLSKYVCPPLVVIEALFRLMPEVPVTPNTATFRFAPSSPSSPRLTTVPRST